MWVRYMKPFPPIILYFFNLAFQAVRGFVNQETGLEGTENFKFWSDGVPLTVAGSQAEFSLTANSPVPSECPSKRIFKFYINVLTPSF